MSRTLTSGTDAAIPASSRVLPSGNVALSPLTQISPTGSSPTVPNRPPPHGRPTRAGVSARGVTADTGARQPGTDDSDRSRGDDHRPDRQPSTRTGPRKRGLVRGVGYHRPSRPQLTG